MTGEGQVEEARLISIIGPPAVGKTTLAEALAQRLPARLIREDYAGNPFLAASYTGSVQSRLPSQLYFLLSRVAQLSRADRPESGLTVSDYGFCQDPIYARLRLNQDDFAAYSGILDRLAGAVHPPDAVICLDASVATLSERIDRRGRAYEAAMTTEFLASMRQAYDDAALRVNCPVIRVDCDATDILIEAEQVEITERLWEILGCK